MYSIIEVCGKQVKVSAGDRIRVSSLEGEANSVVNFDKVLLVSDGETVSIGKPYVEGAVVKATLTAQLRGEKIFVFKKRRRKDYDKKTGHRQALTELVITEVALGSKKETYEIRKREPKTAVAA